MSGERITAPGSIAERGLRAIVEEQRARMARLQAFADEAGRLELIEARGEVHDVPTAQIALERYDRDWFASSVYSDDLKREFARSLLEATAPWPFLNREQWEEVLREDGSEAK